MAEKLPEKQWYIATTYSSHEDKVAENIRRRAESMNLQDKIFRIIVANEEIPVYKKDKTPQMVVVDGVEKQKVKIKNAFPGYIFVEMIMTDDSWFMVRNTEGVTGIAGSSGGGQKPTPVSANEMETILKKMGYVDKSMYDQYHDGDLIKIVSGTFANTEGTIVGIDKDTGVVKVDIIFFGRHVTAEVEFKDIVRI